MHKLIPEIGGNKQLETVCIAWSTKIAYALLQRMLRSDGVIILRKTWDKTDPDLREMLRIEIEKGKKYPPPEKLAALYCYAGCFSAVAYEYLYLLNQESHAEKTIDRISEICRNFYQTLKLRVHPIQLDFREGSGEKKISSERINLHFADCFSEREKISEGTDSNNQSKERSVLPQILETLYKDLVIKDPNDPSADDEKALPQIRKYLKLKDDSPTDDEDSAQENAPIRNDTLQSAFNSPFKPFVLTTTSIGQEGLDFHWYCRKIMHWNLPGNPVKFDQREGRINRFCSFALRQILTKTKECSCEFSWPELFKKFQKKDSGGNGMIPMWLPPPNENEATSAARPEYQDKIDKALDRRIERIVPFFPLSREHLWLDNLIKLQGIYRMVIGQPHQEELLSLLRDLSEEKRQQIKELTISLAPKCPWKKALRKKRKSFSPKTGRRFR